MNKIWQVCIVGGGPAGCAAAIAAGLQPNQVLLLEAKSPWRDKPCGDAITRIGVIALSDLGFNARDVRSAGGNQFVRIGVFVRGLKMVEFRSEDSTGWMVRRSTLDQFLRDRVAQYCTVRYDATALDIREDAKGFTLRVTNAQRKITEERCRFVILATGAHNGLSRRLAVSGNANNAPALSSYWQREDDGQLALRVFFDETLFPGYAWEFDVDRNTVNIGVCALNALSGREIKKRASAAAKRWPCLSNSVWRGGTVPLWSGDGTTWHSATGLVSCGDAAGVADPLTGEGIGPALETGTWAGKCARDYLDGFGEAALRRFSSRIHEQFGARYTNNPGRSLLRLLSGVQNT